MCDLSTHMPQNIILENLTFPLNSLKYPVMEQIVNNLLHIAPRYSSLQNLHQVKIWTVYRSKIWDHSKRPKCTQTSVKGKNPEAQDFVLFLFHLLFY